MDTTTMLVLSKNITIQDNIKAVYYGYRQQLNDKGELVDVITPMSDNEGKPVMRALSIKVALTDTFIKDNKDKQFPLYVKVDTNKKDEKGNSYAFVTVDKDASGKIRRDKYGKKHLVLVINKSEEVTEAPRKTYTLDDLDTFEG